MPSKPGEYVQVEYTPEFKRNLRGLAKKYHHIRSDIQPVIQQLQVGDIPGDQIPRTASSIFSVYSERVR